MKQCSLHVTFQSRRTYSGIQNRGKSFAILTGSGLHDEMNLNMNHRELK